MDSDTIKLIGAVLSGGLAGSLVTALTTTYRSRKQPIGYRVRADQILKPLVASNFTARLVIGGTSAETAYDNVIVVRVQLVNKGNKDWDNFNVTFPLGQGQFLFAEYAPSSQVHQVTQTTSVDPQAPAPVISVELRPFNRGDSLVFTFAIIGASPKAALAISPVSTLPVRFSSMDDTPEVLRAIAVASLTYLPMVGRQISDIIENFDKTRPTDLIKSSSAEWRPLLPKERLLPNPAQAYFFATETYAAFDLGRASFSFVLSLTVVNAGSDAFTLPSGELLDCKMFLRSGMMNDVDLETVSVTQSSSGNLWNPSKSGTITIEGKFPVGRARDLKLALEKIAKHFLSVRLQGNISIAAAGKNIPVKIDTSIVLPVNENRTSQALQYWAQAAFESGTKP